MPEFYESFAKGETMKRTVPFLRRNNDGASAVEFAIVAPVLLLLIFGIIEFGLIMFVSSVVEGATANAARLAKTGAERSEAGTPAERASEDSARIRAIILERGGGLIDNNNLTVTITPMQGGAPGTVGESGEMVVYETIYNWELFTPLMANIIAPSDGVFPVKAMSFVVNEPYSDDPN